MNQTPISAKIIADSINVANGARLTTMLLVYPRFVHAENCRHRAFSLAVASSRAIPAAKFREMVEQAPAMPVWWGKNQPGMQAREELTGEALKVAKAGWLMARQKMIDAHLALEFAGLHKQICNRILEAWMPVVVLCSGTDWKNFFALRCHPDAQPEIQAVADAALYQYVHSKPDPKIVGGGGAANWHLPFITPQEIQEVDNLATLQKMSVARCARTSYANFDRKEVAKDIELADRLAASGHWSPFEHVAVPYQSGYIGNFRGWLQYRKMYPGENKENLVDLDLAALLEQRQKAGSRFAQANPS